MTLRGRSLTATSTHATVTDGPEVPSSWWRSPQGDVEDRSKPSERCSETSTTLWTCWNSHDCRTWPWSGPTTVLPCNHLHGRLSSLVLLIKRWRWFLSHLPGGRLPLLSASGQLSSQEERHRPSTRGMWVSTTCLRLLRSFVSVEIEPTTYWSQVPTPYHCASTGCAKINCTILCKVYVPLHAKFYGVRPRGIPPSGVKRKRSMPNIATWVMSKAIMSETVQDTASGTLKTRKSYPENPTVPLWTL